MNLVFKLLGKNTSPARIAGFVISNFIGLAIIVGALFFYEDAGSLWSSDDSFIRNDYLVVNKKVGGSSTWEGKAPSFSEQDINDISSQPWVRKIGRFKANDYRVWATVERGGQGMSTMMFFESVPDEFVDAAKNDWNFQDGDKVVPVIISKDYLTLYNFGFAGSAGLPQMTEGLMGGIPLHLTLTSEDGTKQSRLDARIVGFSNRLNTILVPEGFMNWSNSLLGNPAKQDSTANETRRLIIDTNSPGDVAIQQYLDAHDMEMAGDKRSSSASYLLKIITGVIIAVGGVITLLSFFILLLSMSLLMEKNREKLHSLLMLGYPLREVAAPYIYIVVLAGLVAYGLAAGCGLLLRGTYIHALEGLGVESGGVWVGLMVGGILTVILIVVNVIAVRRRVVSSWRRGSWVH